MTPGGMPADEGVADSGQPDLTWSIQTTLGTFDIPESVLVLETAGIRIPVADGPGLEDMSDEQRARFDAPDGSLAASGYWAGLGVNVVVEEAGGMIHIRRSFFDEEDPSLDGTNYVELAAIPWEALRSFANDSSSRSSWTQCFSATHGVTSSTYDVSVEEGMISGDVRVVIEDHDNGYFTSARITADGIQVGALLFLEHETHIENDVQRGVAIWRVDDADAPTRLTEDDVAFAACEAS